MVVFGAFFSAACAGFLNKCMGRRRVLLLGSFFCSIGALGMAVAFNLFSMICARLVVGLGVGLLTHSVPLYISECAPTRLRGRLVLLNDMCCVVGQVSAAVTSTA